MKLKTPHTYILVSILIIFTAIMTWVLPTGSFDRVAINGRQTVVAGTYKAVEANPQGIFDVLKAPFNGIVAAAEIIAFVLVVGGVFGILAKSGAIEAGIRAVIRKVQKKDIIIIPVCMFVFSLGGSIIGMSEETLPLYLIFIPLLLKLGFDTVTGISVVYLGAASGYYASTLNPFSTGIAQAIAGLPPGSGIAFRLVIYVFIVSLAIAFVMRHALRVRKNVALSPCPEIDAQNRLLYASSASTENEHESMSLSEKLVLLSLAVGLCLLVFGVLQWGWYIGEISAIFLAIGVFAVIFSRINTSDACAFFTSGAADLLSAALIIGFARGIVIVAQDGVIIDTVLNSAAGLLSNISSGAFSILMMLINFVLAIFVPSSSGHAALAIPIMAPLSDLVNVDRQQVVTAYLFGHGMAIYAAPTAPVLMASLAIGKVPFTTWLKHIMPLFIVTVIVSCIFMVLGNYVSY